VRLLFVGLVRSLLSKTLIVSFSSLGASFFVKHN
jgi:hypothetical protein